jgi:uncharacterized protein YoxC
MTKNYRELSGGVRESRLLTALQKHGYGLIDHQRYIKSRNDDKTEVEAYNLMHREAGYDFNKARKVTQEITEFRRSEPRAAKPTKARKNQEVQRLLDAAYKARLEGMERLGGHAKWLGVDKNGLIVHRYDNDSGESLELAVGSGVSPNTVVTGGEGFKDPSELEGLQSWISSKAPVISVNCGQSGASVLLKTDGYETLDRGGSEKRYSFSFSRPPEQQGEAEVGCMHFEAAGTMGRFIQPYSDTIPEKVVNESMSQLENILDMCVWICQELDGKGEGEKDTTVWFHDSDGSGDSLCIAIVFQLVRRMYDNSSFRPSPEAITALFEESLLNVGVVKPFSRFLRLLMAFNNDAAAWKGFFGESRIMERAADMRGHSPVVSDKINTAFFKFRHDIFKHGLIFLATQISVMVARAKQQHKDNADSLGHTHMAQQNLAGQVDVLMGQKKNLVLQSKDLGDDIRAKKDELASIGVQIKELNQRLQARQKDGDAQRHKEEHNALMLEEKQMVIDDLAGKVARRGAMIDGLRDELLAKEIEVTEAKGKLNNRRLSTGGKEEELTTKLSASERERIILRNQLQKFSSQLDEMMKSSSERQLELQGIVTEKEAKLGDKETENESLRAEIERLGMEKDNYKTSRGKYKRSYHEIDKLVQGRAMSKGGQVALSIFIILITGIVPAVLGGLIQLACTRRQGQRWNGKFLFCDEKNRGPGYKRLRSDSVSSVSSSGSVEDALGSGYNTPKNSKVEMHEVGASPWGN